MFKYLQNTGTPLVGKKRIQINFVMRPIKFMPLAENLPRTVIPTIWLDEVSHNINKNCCAVFKHL